MSEETQRSALVVVSHPDPGSLNHALAAEIAKTWAAEGIRTNLVDLHAIGFDPVLSTLEACGRPTVDALVRTQMDLLVGSNLLAVVHPNCWGAPPAMMKGWMDRVFAPGAAYAFAKGVDDGEAPKGLLPGRRALVINTSNTTEERERAVFGDPLERIWRDCLLGYCGFARVERQVYRVVAWSDETTREEWLRDAAARATALAKVDVQGEPLEKEGR